MRKRYDIFFLSNLFFLFVQVLDEEKLESYFIESEKKEKKRGGRGDCWRRKFFLCV